MTTSDPVGTALSSIGAGASTGAAVLTAGVLLLRVLQAGNPDMPVQQGGAILGTSAILGVVAAAATGWARTRTIPDLWRRGVTSVIAVFGAAILAVFATAADMVGRRVGLGLYLAVLIVAALATHRAAAHTAGG